MTWVAIGVAVVGAGVTVAQADKARKKANQESDKQEVMAYAKSAVDKLIYDKVHPYDIVRMAKKGKINSPVLGHGKKTDDLFRRYVVAYAIKET